MNRTKLSSRIVGTGKCLPSKKVTNKDLESFVDTTDEWIVSHTGIESRYIAEGADESCSNMGIKAANIALKRSGLSPEEIDLVIVATISPDFKHFPSTAALIQEGIGAKNAGAFDLGAACTGFVYALSMADGAIASGTAKNVLCVGVEKMSTLLNWEDRSTCVLFGDGAGAAIVSGVKETECGVIDSILGSDGSGADHLKVEAGGSTNPITENTLKEDKYLYMNGRAVYNFAVAKCGEVLKELCERNSITMNDIDWIVPHQANFRIISATAKRLKFPAEKFFMNINKYANTTGATIPLALDDMEEQGLLKKGMKILTIGFGAGLTFGGNYIIW